ncbi:DUF5067 domain-containing protein [bacterium]|nr:DUF5067 domain-containing protein [bacterium]
MKKITSLLTIISICTTLLSTGCTTTTKPSNTNTNNDSVIQYDAPGMSALTSSNSQTENPIFAENTDTPHELTSEITSDTTYETNESAESIAPEKDDNLLQGETEDGISIEVTGLARTIENNENIVIIKYRFINNSEKETSFVMEVSDKVFQNGIQAEPAYASAYDDPESKMTDIKPGAELTISEVYVLNNETDDIDIIVSENFAITRNDLISITVNDKSAVSSFSTSQFEENATDEINISLKSYNLAYDYSNKPILIATYQLIHKYDEPKSWSHLINDKAYQGGIALDTNVIAEADDAQSRLNEIYPNTKYNVTVCYELNDLVTPVNIDCKNYFDYSAETIFKTDIAVDNLKLPQLPTQTTTNPDNQNEPVEQETQIYVLNTSTLKYHKPDCQMANNMLDENREYFEGFVNELLENGYSPCSICQ